MCDEIHRYKIQMKLTLKPSDIICFWLYYLGSIKSANSKIFKISLKTIKFLFRRSYIKKTTWILHSSQTSILFLLVEILPQ